MRRLISSNGMRIQQYLSRMHFVQLQLYLLRLMRKQVSQELLFQMTSFHLLLVRKDRMLVLLQSLLTSRLISRVRARQMLKRMISKNTMSLMRMK